MKCPLYDRFMSALWPMLGLLPCYIGNVEMRERRLSLTVLGLSTYLV